MHIPQMRAASGRAPLPEPLQLSPIGIEPSPQPRSAGERRGGGGNTIYRCLAEANAASTGAALLSQPEMIYWRIAACLSCFFPKMSWGPSAEDRPQAAHGVPRFPRSAKAVFPHRLSPRVSFLCSAASLRQLPWFAGRTAPKWGF